MPILTDLLAVTLMSIYTSLTWYRQRARIKRLTRALEDCRQLCFSSYYDSGGTASERAQAWAEIQAVCARALREK